MEIAKDGFRLLGGSKQIAKPGGEAASVSAGGVPAYGFEPVISVPSGRVRCVSEDR